MSIYNDEDERSNAQFNDGSAQKYERSKSGGESGGSVNSDNSNRKESSSGNGSNKGSNDDTNTDSSNNANDESSDEKDTENDAEGCKIWLEVLPSKGGILLAALLAEIMAEGLTPTQMNILAAFIGSVGSLIGYKAAREDLDVPGPF